MQLPTIPPRPLLAIRVLQLTFGIISLALSAASLQIIRGMPRPATRDNALIIAASAMGLMTTLYRIASYRLREPKARVRMIPYAIEAAVMGLLLAAFISGVSYSTSGRGACWPGSAEEGDGDVGGNNGGSSYACTLTKVSTSFTALNFVTFVASTYTVGKGIYDEMSMAKSEGKLNMSEAPLNR